MFKKSALNHYHLSRSLRLSLSHPLVLCVFPFLFPCGAEVMCFGTVRQLLDKALENDLSISVLSAPQDRWWEKEWEYSQSKGQGRETQEREGRGQSSGNVFTLQAFCTGSSAALIRLPKKTPNYSNIAVGNKVETKPVENTIKKTFTSSLSSILLWQVFNRSTNLFLVVASDAQIKNLN